MKKLTTQARELRNNQINNLLFYNDIVFATHIPSSRRRLTPPSAHRTVRTGPYTAHHGRRIHVLTSNQCGSFVVELTTWPRVSMNHLFGNARSSTRSCDSLQVPLLE